MLCADPVGQTKVLRDMHYLLHGTKHIQGCTVIVGNHSIRMMIYLIARPAEDDRIP